MTTLEEKKFPNERDLYHANDLVLVNCSFDGIEDGESALKEANNIILNHCYFNLRYPLWHDTKISANDILMTSNCRAALWYTNDIEISNSRLLGIKALRECQNIKINKTEIDSPEFGWRSQDINLNEVKITSEYLFFEAKNLLIDKMEFTGKYSFQYVENMEIINSELNTKDAFWHSKNVTIKNSIVKGEYLGWYSENLTFINCKIIGTQPLCYCKNLKLINCTMEQTDLSFEYSDVEADIKGNILSVKNPFKGKIKADSIDNVILTDDSVYPHQCEIITTIKE